MTSSPGRPRRRATADDLAAVVTRAFGPTRRLRGADRLRGGSHKGVYRLWLDDASTAVAYIWDDDENYWVTPPAASPVPGPESAVPEPVSAGSGPVSAVTDPVSAGPGPVSAVTDPVSEGANPVSAEPAVAGSVAASTGLERFRAARAELLAAGAGVPAVHLLDASRTLVRGDVAVVEDLPGGTLEDLIRRDPRRAEPVLRRLGIAVRAMHAHRSERPGRPGVPGAAEPGRVERVVHQRAMADLATATERVEAIADVAQRLEQALLERIAAVEARDVYGLVHGELGPDHVLVDRQGRPVLIDIEGAMFCDVEQEHAFLELRFGAAYHHLAVEGLDPHRLRFYRLCTYLSLVAGPLLLLDGDFPDRAGMVTIVEANVRRTLAELT